MNLKRLLNTPMGTYVVSIILGLGLATLFYKTCSGKHCLNFNGPLINEIDGQTYKFGEECYKYTLQASPCDGTKKTVELENLKSV